METSNAQRPTGLPEIPGYRLEAIIGRGSTGTVYRAVQLAVERKVALKILHPELAARGRAVKRLQREARTTARLSHPGIVSAIDMGHIGTLWWYAMELVEGPSLAAKLRKDGPMSERDAVRLFIPLCEALEHAFEHGVVHRDLKPGNILIDGAGRARIVDLGLAFAEDDPALTNHGGTLGTPHYISPEQARDPKAADVRSDIWSLGATLYHCLCGRPPFAGESVAEILSGVLYSPVPDPSQFAPGLSKGLQFVLRKCLARDPERRYQSPREVREDLEALRERRAVSVRRESLEPLLGEGERRRRRASWSVGVLAVVVAAGLLWFRPWRSDGLDPTRAESTSAFEPLDEIIARLERDPRQLAPALADLEALQGAIPAAHSARADALYSSLRQRFAASIQAAHANFQRELNRLRNDERNLAAALELVQHGFPERLKRELRLSSKQLNEQVALLGLEGLRVDLQHEMVGRVADVGERVGRVFESEHVAPSRESEARGQWVTARAKLAVAASELLERSGISCAGLAAEDVRHELDRVQREQIDRARLELDARWTAGDVERNRELVALEKQLWAELKLRKVTDAADRLRARWIELMARDSLAPDQQLDDVSGLCAATLDRAVRELGESEAANDRADAELALRDFMPGIERDFSAREFERVRGLLDEQLERRTMRPVLERLEALRSEAGILESLMQLAAAEIERLGQTRETVRFSLGVERSGVIEQGNRPLEVGFRFIPSDGGAGKLLALRALDGKRFELLARSDLERLAGLSVSSTDPDLRFQQALLRERTGDLAAAIELWPVAAPTRPEWRPLTEALNERIERARSQRSKELEDRRRKADELLSLVRRAAQDNETATTQRQLEQIETLLKEYPDVDAVRADAPWLRQRREELQRGATSVDADAFRAAFGPNSIELGDNRRVTLRFVLDLDYQGQFARNLWEADARGWVPPRQSGVEDFSNPTIWPSLSLRAPLDLVQSLELDLAFEQPLEAGPPRLLAVTLAGVHVVFAGATDQGASARYAIGSGPDSALMELTQSLIARKGGVGSPFKGLQKGGRHQLRIELRQGRGKVDVLLDGERLDSKATLRPDASAVDFNDRSLVVRSFERVRLLEATLRGGY